MLKRPLLPLSVRLGSGSLCLLLLDLSVVLTIRTLGSKGIVVG